MKTFQIVRDARGQFLTSVEAARKDFDGVPMEAVVEDGQKVELMERAPLSYTVELADFVKKLSGRKG